MENQKGYFPKEKPGLIQSPSIRTGSVETFILGVEQQPFDTKEKDNEDDSQTQAQAEEQGGPDTKSTSIPSSPPHNPVSHLLHALRARLNARIDTTARRIAALRTESDTNMKRWAAARACYQARSLAWARGGDTPAWDAPASPFPFDTRRRYRAEMVCADVTWRRTLDFRSPEGRARALAWFDEVFAVQESAHMREALLCERWERRRALWAGGVGGWLARQLNQARLLNVSIPVLVTVQVRQLAD